MDRVKLGDVVEILDSRRVPVSSAERAKRAKIYPYYGAQGVVDYIDDYLFDGSYVLVAEDGNNLKALSEPIVTWVSGQFWVNNHAHILGDNGKADIRYIYYYLMASDLRGLITGSAQPKLNQENLASFSLELPSLSEQKRVSAILGALDDAIANNNALIKELEKTSRLVYDYWFTQFDFPDENGNPYRSSGGKMIWNEELKREIPEGWEVGSLSGYVELGRDAIQPASTVLYEHYSIPAFDGERVPVFEYGKDIASGKHRIANGCLLYAKLNPKFKRLWYPAVETNEAICSTEFLVMEPINSDLLPYCFAVLDSDAFYAHMVSKAVSSTGSRSRVDSEVALDYRMVLAPESVPLDFSGRFGFLYDMMQKLIKEGAHLRSLRDWLLPMLMSGQARLE